MRAFVKCLVPLAAVCAMIVVCLPASGWTWHGRYGGASCDWGWDLVPTQDGGHAVVGTTYSFGGGNGDMWVVKFDADGYIEWQRTYGNSPLYEYGEAVVELPNGNLGALGGQIDYAAEEGVLALLELDISDGSVVWGKLFGFGGWDVATGLALVSDGGLCLSATTESLQRHGFGANDAWVMKTDGSGNILWSKVFGCGCEDWGQEVIRVGADVVLGGYTSAAGAGGQDFFLVRLTGNGDIEHQVAYGGTGSDFLHHLALGPDGGVVAAGWTTSWGNLGPAVYYDTWVLSVGEDGSYGWSKAYGTQMEEMFFGIGAFDEGYALTGDLHAPIAGRSPGQDMWVLRIDGAGDMQWARAYGDPEDLDHGMFVAESQGGLPTVLASTFGFDDTEGDEDLWVLRLDTDGTLTEECDVELPYDPVQTDIEAQEVSVFDLSANQSWHSADATPQSVDVTDPGADSEAWTFRCPETPPCTMNCGVSAEPAGGFAPLTVAFAAAVSFFNCVGDPTYEWDFGDGTSYFGGPAETHTYDQPGSYIYTVTVRVDDAECNVGHTLVVDQGSPGDCDGSGRVTIGEVQRAINMFLGTEPIACNVDTNGDGNISIGEVQTIINAFLGG